MFLTTSNFLTWLEFPYMLRSKERRKDIGVRFCDFGSEMVTNRRTKKKSFVVSLHHSLLMDLGHNQQQHPAVHSGGVIRVSYCSPSAHLPLPFRSPFGNWETQPFSNVFSRIQLFKLLSTFFNRV